MPFLAELILLSHIINVPPGIDLNSIDEGSDGVVGISLLLSFSFGC